MEKTCPICESRTELIRDNVCGYMKGSSYSVRECASCLVQFVDPLRTDGKIYEQIYKNAREVPGYERYSRYAEEVSRASDPLDYLSQVEDSYYFIRCAIQRVLAGRTARVLEVGCGLGYLTYALRASGCETWGVDIAKTSIDLATERYGPWYLWSDVDRLSDIYNNFDFVIMTEVLEHVEDPMQLIRAALARLAPDGTLLVTTPNRDLYRRGLVWHTELPPVHLWWFSEVSVHALGSQCGCRVELFDFSNWNARSKKERGCELVREMRRENVPILDVDGKLYMSNDAKGNGGIPSRLSPFRRGLAIAAGAWRGALDRWENPLGTIDVCDPSRSKTMGIAMQIR
jgi:SAM-dependent methyltransferase